MRKIALKCSYLGTEYHGFQIQGNTKTLCLTIQSTLCSIVGEDVYIKGCSRTDAGVHAEGFVLCVYTSSRISADGLLRAMNVRLPSDISVLCAAEVGEEFHPRYSCVGKKYIYRILNSKVRNPFWHNRALYYDRKLQISKMQDAAKLLLGKHDFKGFSAKSSVENTVRTIFDISFNYENDMLEICIYGDGFLYNMVRIIVGTLLSISENRLNNEDILYILKSGDRAKAGATVPAHGLYLHSVVYMDDPFCAAKY